MAGCARRELRQHGLALATGWYAANFSRADRLKGLDHYLAKLKPQTAQSVADEAAALFEGLRAKGLVRIRERRKDT
jgi:hypothetical protein